MLLDDSYPVGDPAGMRALAARLRRLAESIDTHAQDASSDARHVLFEGPAGERFKGDVADNSGDARRAADALISVSQTLLRAATEVEAQQRAWLRLRARMMAEGQRQGL